MLASPDAAAGDDAAPDCTDHRACDDAVFCNGTERCDRGAAPPSRAPQVCGEDLARCFADCGAMCDRDGDGRDAEECGGDDCDDADPASYPGNAEIPDSAWHDEDCNPETVGPRDVDGDGFVDARCCNGPTCGTDCNDLAAGASPGATEVCNRCNAIDDDCCAGPDYFVAPGDTVDDDRDGVADAECVGLAADANGAHCGECDRECILFSAFPACVDGACAVTATGTTPTAARSTPRARSRTALSAAARARSHTRARRVPRARAASGCATRAGSTATASPRTGARSIGWPTSRTAVRAIAPVSPSAVWPPSPAMPGAAGSSRATTTITADLGPTPPPISRVQVQLAGQVAAEIYGSNDGTTYELLRFFEGLPGFSTAVVDLAPARSFPSRDRVLLPQAGERDSDLHLPIAPVTGTWISRES